MLASAGSFVVGLLVVDEEPHPAGVVELVPVGGQVDDGDALDAGGLELVAQHAGAHGRRSHARVAREHDLLDRLRGGGGAAGGEATAFACDLAEMPATAAASRPR